VEFEVDAWTDESEVRIRLHGELDLAAVPGMRAALQEAATTPGKPVVTVDLRAVTFMDCSALGELIHGRAVALRHGLGYQVVGAHGVALRVMRVTGTLALLS
jgi:anti-sigma B factor antagonist